MQGIFMPREKTKSAKINLPSVPTEATAAEGVAEVTKGKQGRGLASTNLSGMRRMMDTYSSGKQTLGGA